jgi:hypothetical protein
VAQGPAVYPSLDLDARALLVAIGVFLNAQHTQFANTLKVLGRLAILAKDWGGTVLLLVFL